MASAMPKSHPPLVIPNRFSGEKSVSLNSRFFAELEMTIYRIQSSAESLLFISPFLINHKLKIRIKFLFPRILLEAARQLELRMISPLARTTFTIFV